MFLLSGKSLPIDTAFTVGEGPAAIQYPANWLRLSSPEERTALGITEVPDPVRPDDTYHWVVDNGDGTFAVTLKPLDPFKKQFAEEIDMHIARIMAKPQRFLVEYEDREKSARDFIAGQSAEGADESIVEFAANNAMTYAETCALVVQQADAYRAAVRPLGKLRMMKGRIENAATIEEMLAIRQTIITESSAIEAQLP